MKKKQSAISAMLPCAVEEFEIKTGQFIVEKASEGFSKVFTHT